VSPTGVTLPDEAEASAAHGAVATQAVASKAPPPAALLPAPSSIPSPLPPPVPPLPEALPPAPALPAWGSQLSGQLSSGSGELPASVARLHSERYGS